MGSKDIIYLEKGKVYFHAAFLDEGLTIPSIETYIFTGSDDKYYLFKDAQDESVKIGFEKDKIICIYDSRALSKWLLEDHSPKHPMQTEYLYRIRK